MRHQFAFTLIEIIVTLVVIAISATALMSVYTNMVRGSADPVIQQQATTIAEAYLEEIMLKAFQEPLPGIEIGTAEAGETRASYNDVQDYNSLPVDNLIRDQNGNLVPLLSDFRVTVTVAGVVLNTVNTMQIVVTVTHPPTIARTGTITLNAFRANY